VVWVAKGHGKEVLDQFFQILTKEQREAIRAVSGGGDKQQNKAPNSNRLRLPEYRHAYQLCNAVLFSNKNSMAQK
jgi:hypothetical protein